MRTDQIKFSQQTRSIGRAHMTSVPSLPGGQGGGRIMALGNMATNNCPTLAMLEDTHNHEHLDLIDCLVVGTLCDLDRMFNAIKKLKEIHPALKVILADCKENSRLAGEDPPEGVESVILVSKDNAETGRSLLFHQSAILAGTNAGMAAYLAFIMEAQIQNRATIAIATTNISPELFGLSP